MTSLTRREVEARLGAVERSWGPRSVRVENGPATGRRQIDLRHLGGLDVTVETDQFLDLGDASWQGESVSFTAQTTSPRAESWGRRWLGGLLTTCGLTAVGQASVAEGGTHGRAHLIPATLTRSEGRWEGNNFLLEVAGQLREGGIFEENLSVHRSITASHGCSRIRVTDQVRNEGFEPVPVKLLYHINLGWPLVEAGSRVVAAASGPDEPAGSGWRATLVAPTASEPESVAALVADADPQGWCAATLESGNNAVTVRFRTAELPYLTIWRSPAAGSYALGIEPGTCWPSHVPGPERGKAGHGLPPGASFTSELEIEFSIRDV